MERLLHSLTELNYKKADFEIIIVDDHSTDGTATLATQLLNIYNLNGTVISLQNSKGKKSNYSTI